MDRYRRTGTRHIRDNEKTSFKALLIRQGVISAAIFAVVFVIGLIKSETAMNITEKIHSSISYTVNYQEAVYDIISAVSDFTRGANDDNEKAATD